jgi:hypothetical protein
VAPWRSHTTQIQIGTILKKMLVDFWSFSKEKKNAALTAHTIHTHQKKNTKRFFLYFSVVLVVCPPRQIGLDWRCSLLFPIVLWVQCTTTTKQHEKVCVHARKGRRRVRDDARILLKYKEKLQQLLGTTAGNIWRARC